MRQKKKPPQEINLKTDKRTNMREKLYQRYKQKASKIRKKYLKNEKILNTSIDSVRGFTNYNFVRKLLTDKSFATLRDDKHNQALFSINGTGIKIRIIAKDAKIYYEAFAMSQYYSSDNPKNRKELEKWLLKSEITSIDIAFDSEKRIQLQGLTGKKVGSTTYYNKNNLKSNQISKICCYDKTQKAKYSYKSSFFKNYNYPVKQIYRTEFTLEYSPKHLNKNKKLKRPHSKSARIKGAYARLTPLIENNININITSKPKEKKDFLNLYNFKRLNKIYLSYARGSLPKESKKRKKFKLLLTKLNI